jgi:hypothetical protein
MDDPWRDGVAPSARFEDGRLSAKGREDGDAMIGTTLVDIRGYIEGLADPAGEYYLVCGRTGHRPVPAVGHRFERRTAAQSAARATEQYRAALRRYDPQLPHYDVIVCQDSGPVAPGGQTARRPRSRPRAAAGPSAEDRVGSSEHQTLVEFCHRVAAAIFETLSGREFDAVETAVMDSYFELAERVDDLDNLCLCLLESTAAELSTRLTPVEQADVLSEAATRLTANEPTTRPVSATFSLLQTRGLLGAYTQSASSVDLDEGVQSTVVQVSEYALSPQEGRLPTVPIVLDLYRRQPDWLPSSVRAADADDGWRLTFELAREPELTGLASAPIDSEVT